MISSHRRGRERERGDRFAPKIYHHCLWYFSLSCPEKIFLSIFTFSLLSFERHVGVGELEKRKPHLPIILLFYYCALICLPFSPWLRLAKVTAHCTQKFHLLCSLFFGLFGMLTFKWRCAKNNTMLGTFVRIFIYWATLSSNDLNF